MTTVLVAVVLGLVAGAAGGGRLSDLGGAHLRSWSLLVAGAALQVGTDRGHLQGTAAFLVTFLSYSALAAFAGRNLARPGMGVILVGVLLNLASIGANGGMPVEAHAIVSARVASAEDVADLTFGGKRHLAGPSDHLRALDDTIPDWITHQVLSIGDLVIAVGITALVAALLSPAPPAGARTGADRGRRATG